MPDQQSKKSLRKLFMQLPEKMRDWLASEQVTNVIVALNTRLGTFGLLIEVIPNTILRLVVKDLDPKQFIKELATELDLDFDASKVIAQEIEARILQPIEVPLRTQVGVDIKAIYLGAPAPATPSVAPTPPPIPSRPIPPPIRPPEIMKVPINKPPQSPITEKM